MATLDLDPLVDRVRDAIRDTELPKRSQMPSFEEFTKDLRKVDPQAAVDQLAKAIERIDIPKALERIELPPAIEQRLPGRRKKARAPFGLIGLVGAIAVAVATVALFPPLRRRLRAAIDGLSAQVDGLRGERHWSRGAGFATAFPASQTMPVADDPAIPGAPAPYPEGLGLGDTPLTEHQRTDDPSVGDPVFDQAPLGGSLDEPAIDRPLTETSR